MKGAVFTALFLFWRKQMTKIGKLEIGAGQVRICAPIAYTTEEEIYASLAEIRAKKPDLAEWRIDCFSDYRDAGKVNRVLSRIREELAPIPVLCTLRTSDEGGEAALLPAEYKDFYKELCRASRPDAIDVETITKLETAPEIIQMAKALGVTVIASNHEISFYDAILEARLIPGIGRGLSKIEKFGELIQKLRRESDTLDVPGLLAEVIEVTGYVIELEAEGTDEAKARIENIDELKSKAVSYAEAHSGEEATLGGFLEEIALVADIDSLDNDQDYVALMTLHSAKGLEFPYVYMPNQKYW